MKKSLLILGLLLLANFTKAQNSILLNYEWEDEPTRHELTEEEKKESRVYIKHLLATEIFYTPDDNAIEYYMEHVIKRLNDEESIDENNKVYMAGSKADPDLYTVIEQARVIKADGKVLDLDVDDILEEENEETGRTYRYYALEGLAVGDEVEYFYVYPRAPRTTGTMSRLQSNSLKREATLWTITPKNLINKFKSFNGFPEMEMDSTYEDINFYKGTYKNLPGLRDEKFADVTANKAAVAYYLYKNTASNSSMDYYSNVSKFVAKTFNEINPKKSGVLKFMKKMGLDRSMDEEDQIRFIDNYIKTEVRYIQNGLDGLSDLANVTSKKYGNDRGLTQLYGAIFNEIGVKFEVVYTTDRTELPFDKDFECGIYLDETMLYFPKYKKYLAVSGLSNRYGFPPSVYTSNYGYFTRFIDVGGSKSGVGKTKFIEPVDGNLTVDDFTVTLDLKDLPASSSTLTKTLTGYDAIMYQSIFDFLDEEGKVEIQEGLVNYIDEEMEIGNVEVENMEATDAGINPLKISADFVSEIFVQKAGNNYLINVGKMIGPQSEMYQEEERVLPISRSNNKKYKRQLIITIPEGYEAVNLDQLNMNVVYQADGKDDMGFISTYKLEGNKLIVDCEEFYYSTTYPVDTYDIFQKVINAAADFNKIAILLKKKG